MLSAMPALAEPPPSEELRVRPEMRTTFWDVSRAGLLAMLLGFAASAASAWFIFATIQPAPKMELVAIEIPDATGGFEDGAPDDSADVPSDAAPRPDASPVEVEADTVELMETLDVLVDIADQALPLLPEQTGAAAESTGPAGSSEGSGSRPLGEGGGEGGVPRSQRWLISFPDGATLEEYGKQLDFFGIELGKIGGDGTLTFAADLSGAAPAVRSVETGEGEERLYFEWKGGARQAFDRQLFQKAGVSPEGTVLHFYPQNTENRLAQLEQAASGGRDATQIRRTFFDVRKSGNGYAFEVSKQLFF